MNEQQAVELAAQPHKIIDALQCNEIIGFLNGVITDMRMAEFELELAASQHKVKLLKRENTSIAMSEAEWKISEEYIKWRKIQNELAKFRAYRNSLRNKEEELRNSSKFVRDNYQNYNRVIE